MVGSYIFRIGFIVKRFAATKDSRLGNAIYLGHTVWYFSGHRVQDLSSFSERKWRFCSVLRRGSIIDCFEKVGTVSELCRSRLIPRIIPTMTFLYGVWRICQADSYRSPLTRCDRTSRQTRLQRNNLSKAVNATLAPTLHQKRDGSSFRTSTWRPIISNSAGNS